MPNQQKTAAAVFQLQVPVLGSPPEAWKSVAEIVGKGAPSPYVIAAGFAAWGDRPVMAILFGSTGVIGYFAEPTANNLRAYFAGRVKKRLETED